MRLALALVALLGFACAPSLPARYVIERDLGAFAYRRYQKTLDLELVIPGNDAVGHTASYLRRDAGRVRVATAFVTVYARGHALAAHLTQRLSSMMSYRHDIIELGGEHVHRLQRDDESWVIWPSGRVLVKLGGSADDASPEALSRAYLDLYPSDLDAHGHARPGAGSAGTLPALDEQ